VSDLDLDLDLVAMTVAEDPRLLVRCAITLSTTFSATFRRDISLRLSVSLSF